MKKSNILVLIAVVIAVVVWQRNRSDVNSDFLRELANDAATQCADYYAALPEYAFSERSSLDEERLGISLNNLLSAISEMNLAIFGEDDLRLYPEVMDIASAILRPQDYPEAQRVNFLRVTLKDECRKWQAFAQLSDGEIRAYFKMRNDSLTDRFSRLCDAIESEASRIPTYAEIQIEQCEVQDGTSGEVLIVGLNDWMEWIDFSDPDRTPDSEGLNEYLFDFPLQLIINGFRRANASTSDLEAILIAFRDEAQTVYELRADDAQRAITDSRELSIVLRELRERIKISSL